jgi:hypothetical protein
MHVLCCAAAIAQSGGPYRRQLVALVVHLKVGKHLVGSYLKCTVPVYAVYLTLERNNVLFTGRRLTSGYLCKSSFSGLPCIYTYSRGPPQVLNHLYAVLWIECV